MKLYLNGNKIKFTDSIYKQGNIYIQKNKNDLKIVLKNYNFFNTYEIKKCCDIIEIYLNEYSNNIIVIAQGKTKELQPSLVEIVDLYPSIENTYNYKYFTSDNFCYYSDKGAKSDITNLKEIIKLDKTYNFNEMINYLNIYNLE